ncbi:MAG: ATP-binding cassette domain-containing protein [Clostridia bacterium]|nr:ATP-binding cassette domain-containing protein [Clostridia bacterium]
MPNQNEEVLLRVEHLCQYFKSTKAVDDISFDIKKGEVFGLVGESGCGKTTTGRSIIKLYDITSGNIYFKGKRIAAGTLSYKEAIKKAREEMKSASPDRQAELKGLIDEQRQLMKEAKHDHKHCDQMYADEIAKEVAAKYEPLLAAAPDAEKPELKKRYLDEMRVAKKQRFITQIQMIFQDPIASLDPRKTVYETIAEGLVIRGEKDKKVIDDKVYSVLETVGLVREHASRYPHEFSGGQRQRIGVARAVVMNPEMIIADEPVSALDVSIQAQVINLLNDLRHQLGLTILFIAHDLSVVKYFSDRIGVMYYGKMVELATSDELFAHPLHPYTQSLLSAIPLPDPLYERQRVRIKYDPLSAHDYSEEKPTLREIAPGHFVSCNTREYEAYLAQMKAKP